MLQKITLHVSDLLLREDVVVENYQRVLADNFLIDCKIATKSGNWKTLMTCFEGARVKYGSWMRSSQMALVSRLQTLSSCSPRHKE